MHWWLVLKVMEGCKGGAQQTLETEVNPMWHQARNHWKTSKKSIHSLSQPMRESLLKMLQKARTLTVTSWESMTSKKLNSRRLNPGRKRNLGKRTQSGRSLLPWYRQDQARKPQYPTENRLTKESESWQAKCLAVVLKTRNQLDQLVSKLMVCHKLRWFQLQNIAMTS